MHAYDINFLCCSQQLIQLRIIVIYVMCVLVYNTELCKSVPRHRKNVYNPFFFKYTYMKEMFTYNTETVHEVHI